MFEPMNHKPTHMFETSNYGFKQMFVLSVNVFKHAAYNAPTSCHQQRRLCKTSDARACVYTSVVCWMSNVLHNTDRHALHRGDTCDG